MTAIGFGARFRPMYRGFDFSAGILPPGASFTRASAAMRTDASGTLVSVAANVPRFDHNPATLALRGLLIEPAATNALLSSRDLSAAAWTKSALAAGASVITETNATGTHYAAQSPAFVAGSAYCLAVSAREVSGPKRYLSLFYTANAFGTAVQAKFDLASGTVNFQNAGVTSSITRAPGGRWRCVLRATATATTAAGASSAQLRLSDSSGSPTSYTGDGIGGIDVTDCQIETGANATSPIVTTTAAASRAADVLTLNWAGCGVPDGLTTLRYTFDDGSTQDIATMVSGGIAVVPGTLTGTRLRRVESL